VRRPLGWPRPRLDWRRPPTWLLGLLLAVLTWSIALAPPSVGLDASWIAGVSMATHAGLHYGTDFVFSYGPLGFLGLPLAFYPTFGLLSLVYLCALYIGFCATLVWVLRRRLPGWLCVVLGFALLGLVPLIEQALVLATLLALALLEKERPPWVLHVYVFLAPTFAAVEALTKLSTGPVIALVLILALIGSRPRLWQVGVFFALLVGQLAAFWFATDQTLGNVGPFIENTIEISSGYSTAMMRLVDVPGWQVALATIVAALLSLAMVGVASRLPFRDRRARWCAVLLMVLSVFALYKEGVVRPDAGHLSLYFSSACVLWIGLPWGRARWLLIGAVAIALIGIPMRPKETATNYGVIGNVELAAEQVHALLSNGRREEIIADGRENEKVVYALEPKALAALQGHTVTVEPWETAAVWAYELDWRPPPIFQNYSAYTAHLDRLNATVIESPGGPERILRENPPFVYDEFPTPDLDGRFAGWDPPEQMRTVLCHFEPLTASLRWEVLGRTEDRCGEPVPVEAVEGRYGEPIAVPQPGPGEVVFVRIYGAGVRGLEKLTNLFLHARSRHVLINGTGRFRLVPETAADGLLMVGDPALAEPEGAYSPLPQAQTIEVEGPGGDLTFDFFRMKVAARPGGRSTEGEH
jgi:hypothetical protein